MAPSTESSEEIAFVTQLFLRHTDGFVKGVGLPLLVRGVYIKPFTQHQALLA